MANQRTQLEVVLTARNLIGPTFTQARAQITQVDQSITQTGRAFQTSGKQIDASLKTASGSVSGFAQSVGQGLGVNIPLSIAAATTAVVALGVSGVKSFSDFDKAMRAVNTQTGQTGELAQRTFGENSKAIREFALRMGVDATGAAKGLYEVLGAGIPQGKEAFRVLEVGANAARGGLTTVAVAVDALTSITKAYGLSTAEAQSVSDKMFATVAQGKLTYSELANSIGSVVPVAAAAGVTFDEVGGFIANMTLQGNTAGVAANSLRQVITSIIKPTQEAREAAKFLGLDFSEAGLRAKGLAGFLEGVAEATHGDSEALGILFSDVDGLKGVLASTGTNLDGFKGRIDGVADSTGKAADATAEMNKSVQRDWDDIAAKSEELKLRVGEALIPVLKDVAFFAGEVGASLGLWPSDVPKAEQTERMRDLAGAADAVADAVDLVKDAWAGLNKIAEESPDLKSMFAGPEGGGSNFEAIARGVGTLATSQRDAAAAAANRTKVEAALRAELDAGTITSAEYNAAIQTLHGVQGAQIDRTRILTAAELAAAEAHEESAKAAGHAMAAAAEQAAAELEAANAQAQATQKKRVLTKEEQQSIRDKMAAAKAAADELKRTQDEAVREAKRLHDQEVREAAQRAKDIAKANEDATASYAKYGREIGDAVSDGLRRVQEIRDRHDEQYNQAIEDATRDQARIKERAGEDLARLEEETGRKVLDLQADLLAIQEGRNKEAVDRQARFVREAEDLRIRAAERDEDRQLAQDRRDADRAKARQQAAEDLAELEQKLGAGGAGGTEGADADAARAKAKAEADQKKAEAEAEATARKTRDLEEETEKHRREERDETQRHTRALRDADTEEAKAKEREKHADAVAQEDERHADAEKKIAQEFKDANDRAKKQATEDEKRRDEAHKDAMDRIKKQFDEQKKRLDASAKDRLNAIQATEDEQKRADGRADAREKTRHDLAVAREKEDFENRQRDAEAKLQDDLQKVKDKAAADKTATETRRELDITASNAALVAKQGQIDAARDADLTKFKADIRARFRDMEQAFGDSMKAMDKLIPGRVASLIGGAGQTTAAAAAGLEAAAQVGAPPRGDSDVSGPVGVGPEAPTIGPEGSQSMVGQPVGTIQLTELPTEDDHIVDEVADDLGNGMAQNYHVWASGKRTPNGGPYRIGEGAAAPPPGGAALAPQAAGVGAASPTAGLDAVVSRLRRAIQIAEGLVGGDARAASAPPTAVAKGGTGTGLNLNWGMAQVGSQEFNGLCQRFVEAMAGTSGRYASAKAAAGALMTNAGGALADAPRGALVFFRPDSSNGNWGHVGASLGGGQFLSATYNGVSVDGPSRYWSGLYQGWGMPHFGGGGVMPGVAGQPGLATLHGGEGVFTPEQMAALGGMRGGGVANVTFQLDGATFARVQAPLVQDEQNRLVRLRVV